jgi:hypothetical protein
MRKRKQLGIVSSQKDFSQYEAISEMTGKRSKALKDTGYYNTSFNIKQKIEKERQLQLRQMIEEQNLNQDDQEVPIDLIYP